MSSIINSKSRSVPSEGTSTSFTPTPAFDACSLLRRFSTPFLYAGGNSATEQHGPQRAIDPAIRAHSKVHTSPVFSESPPDGVHRYNLMSRGSDYAFIEVSSRGPNDQDPLLHFGEELTGFIVLSPGGLRCMQRIDLVDIRSCRCSSPTLLSRQARLSMFSYSNRSTFRISRMDNIVGPFPFHSHPLQSRPQAHP
ncbi:hypothetical protein BJV78DRAFT_813475 [Lactifluus subvellereus]|nr:hypothetical protein BJV78DRAFT_813475 [Lactifluus subvellereus]